MILGLQFLTLNCISRVFSLKSFLEKLFTISWIMWVYIMLVKEWEKAHLKSSSSEFRGSLATWLESWSDSWNPVWHETVQILACASHVAFHGLSLTSQLRASHEFFFFTNFHQTLTLNPYIKSQKKYREMIEQNYNQIWHRIKNQQKHSCKSQLYKNK